MNWHDILRDFVTLWVVIDPISGVPIFLAATVGASGELRRQIALRAIPIAALVLVFFIIFGQLLLDALGISLTSFQIAGGIVLFLFALKMIFQQPLTGDDEPLTNPSPMQSAIFPVAIPSIAGPGTMLTVVLLTDNRSFTMGDQVQTTLVLCAILAISLLFFLLATPIHKLIGQSGENIISRVMGMVLAALAVDTVLRALTELGLFSAAT